MTTEIQMNDYQAALAKFVAAKNYKDKNLELAQRTIARLSDKRVTDLLEASNVDAESFNSDLYKNSYKVRFVRYTFTSERSDFYKISSVAFRTAMLCLKNDEDLLMSDIIATVNVNATISDERAHLIYHHNERIDDQSNRQANAAIDLLCEFNIATMTSKNVYKLQRNAIADAMIAALQLDMTRDDDEEIEVEMLEVAEVEQVEILDSENVTR